MYNNNTSQCWAGRDVRAGTLLGLLLDLSCALGLLGFRLAAGILIVPSSPKARSDEEPSKAHLCLVGCALQLVVTLLLRIGKQNGGSDVDPRDDR